MLRVQIYWIWFEMNKRCCFDKRWIMTVKKIALLFIYVEWVKYEQVMYASLLVLLWRTKRERAHFFNVTYERLLTLYGFLPYLQYAHISVNPFNSGIYFLRSWISSTRLHAGLKGLKEAYNRFELKFLKKDFNGFHQLLRIIKSIS
jgi:hypothetical protein